MPAGKTKPTAAAILALLGLACAFLVHEFWPRNDLPKGTPVILVTIDTLRPDALGWVAHRNATPVLDSVAASGVSFPNAVSSTPLTLPSHASLFSGRYPARHGVRDNGQVVPGAVELLAERLTTAGYATAAFVSAYVLRTQFGLDRGFEHYDDTMTQGNEGWLERPAGETVDAALAWINDHPGKPVFAWVHLYDAHSPYFPPPEFRGTDPRGNYDGEVRYLDRELGRLFAAADKWRVQPLIIVTADHGEAFGEHGEVDHGLFIYDTTTRVPLVFHHPGLKPAHPHGEPRLVDVAPTILDLLGLPAIPGTDGVSLSPLLHGQNQALPPAYSETYQPWTTYGWSPLAAIHMDGWKAIDSPAPELYDLTNDPAEAKDLAASDLVRLDRMRLAIESNRSPPDMLDSTRIEDAQTMQKLASLGYLGSATTTNIPTQGLANPADMLETRNALLRAEGDLRSNRLEHALMEFQQALKADPTNRFATLRSGIALLKLGRLPEAVTYLQASLKLNPAQPETQYALADALSRSGRFEEALPHWLETIRLQPRRVAAWGNMAHVLSRLGKQQEALRALDSALEIEPDNLQILQNLALQQRAAGNRDGSIATLEHAARVGGDGFLYSAMLGLQLYDAGRIPDATQWLERTRPQDLNYAETRYRLAQIKLTAGDMPGARRLLNEAIQVNPVLAKAASADPALKGLLTNSVAPGK